MEGYFGLCRSCLTLGYSCLHFFVFFLLFFSPVSVEGWKGTGEKLLSRADQEHQLAEQVKRHDKVAGRKISINFYFGCMHSYLFIGTSRAARHPGYVLQFFFFPFHCLATLNKSIFFLFSSTSIVYKLYHILSSFFDAPYFSSFFLLLLVNLIMPKSFLLYLFIIFLLLFLFLFFLLRSLLLPPVPPLSLFFDSSITLSP